MRLLRMVDVASRLAVSRSQAYALAQRREFPVIRLGDRSIRVPSDLLDEWIHRRTESALDDSSDDRHT